MSFVSAGEITVRLLGGDHHFPVTGTLTALGAVASPIIALIVARTVTARTIANDQTQRAADRNQEWHKQLQDRQLTSSADFAHAVFQSLVTIERLNPTYAEPTPERLAESNVRLEAARQEMSKVQLLFRHSALAASKAAQRVVDELNTAQRALEKRQTLTDPDERAEAQAEYSGAADDARAAYDTFLEHTASALEKRPDAAAA